MNVKEYFDMNADDYTAYFSLPDYDYVYGLTIEYDEEDDVYLAMGNESWNETEYKGDTDMSVVITDFTSEWTEMIKLVCKIFKNLEYDKRIYKTDDYDRYMILLNSGKDYGLNVSDCYDPHRGEYIVVVSNK